LCRIQRLRTLALASIDSSRGGEVPKLIAN
jgi:hypothetical protein